MLKKNETANNYIVYHTSSIEARGRVNGRTQIHWFRDILAQSVDLITILVQIRIRSAWINYFSFTAMNWRCGFFKKLPTRCACLDEFQCCLSTSVARKKRNCDKMPSFRPTPTKIHDPTFVENYILRSKLLNDHF